MEYGLDAIYYPGTFSTVEELYSDDPEQRAHAEAWAADRDNIHVPAEWLGSSTLPAAITIEPFDNTKHDCKELASFHLQLRRWQELTGQNTFRKIFSSQQDLLHIEDAYVSPDGNFFVAGDGNTGALAGFVGLKRISDTPQIGEIKRLAVHPLHQGQGVARRLVQQLIQWADQESYAAIELGTSYDENAHHLYRKLGFKVTGFNDDSQDWLMRLEL